jgi:hypothetical protein
MKAAIAMRMTAVKKITVTIVSLLCAAAWLAALVYFCLRSNFKKAPEHGGIEVPGALESTETYK